MQPVLEVLTLTSLPDKIDSLAEESKSASLADTGAKAYTLLHLSARVLLADIEIDYDIPAKAEHDLKCLWKQVRRSRSDKE